MDLRVATYNIHKGVSPLGLRNRVHDLRVALDELGADLVFLQEVQDVNLRHARRFANWPHESQTRFLAGSGYHSVYGGNAVYEHGHHGNAILARDSFVHAVNHDISDHPFERRGMLHAVQPVGGVDVHCVCVHLGLFAASRRRQSDAIVDLVRERVPRDAPLIIAGDFNDWRNRLTDTLHAAIGVREVASEGRPSGFGGFAGVGTPQPARTFPALLPWLGLDRIYVRGFRVVRVHVPRGARWARLSDHAPLVSDLVMAPHG